MVFQLTQIGIYVVLLEGSDSISFGRRIRFLDPTETASSDIVRSVLP